MSRTPRDTADRDAGSNAVSTDEHGEAAEFGRVPAAVLESLGRGLRTPVDAILGAARRLTALPLDGVAREAARGVEASAESLKLLADDLLDEPQSAESVTDVPSPFDLGTVLRETLDHVAVRTNDLGIDLQMRYATDAPRRVVGQGRRVSRLAANLVAGAVETARAGFVLLEVLCVERTDERAWLELRVGPAGGEIGEAERSAGSTSVAPEILPAFAPRDRGALALALCERLAATLGGAAGVRGQAGSIFWARLPFGIEVGGSEHDLASVLRRMRILVMGDPAPGTRVLVEKVESWGASPSTVPSPKDTVEAIRRGVAAGEPYEAVVVHVSGAGAGVERLAKEVRGDRLLRMTPLIAVAVRGLRGDARRFTQAGYDAYLAGPVRDGVLLTTLRLLRERGPGWNALASGGERDARGGAGAR